MAEQQKKFQELLQTVVDQNQAPILEKLLKSFEPVEVLQALKKMWEDTGDTLLHYACQKGSDVAVIQVILNWTKDVNLRSKKGSKPTALLLACAHSNADVCRLLINNKASLDEVDTMEDTVLHAACKNKDVNVLRVLLEEHRAGYLVNHRNKEGSFPLLVACNFGSRTVESARLLLQHGASIDMAGTFEGWTALISACRYNKPDLVRFLLQNNANPMIKETANGEFALTKAAENGLVEVVRELLKYGDHRMEALWNGLLMAATQKKSEVVDMILKSIDERNPNKYLAPCLHAVYHGDLDCLTEIIGQAGTKVHNFVTSSRLLIMASASGQCQIISNLMRLLKIDIDAQDEAGLTPLHIAAYACHAECVRELVGAGADVNLKDNCMKSALLHASFGSSFADTNECHSVLSTLLKNGADPNSPSISTTPLHRLSMTGHVDHVRLLCEFRASLTLTNIYGKYPMEVAWREDLQSILHTIYDEYQTRNCNFFLKSNLSVHPSLVHQLRQQWLSKNPSTVAALRRYIQKKDSGIRRKMLELCAAMESVEKDRAEVREMEQMVREIEEGARGNMKKPETPEAISWTTKEECYKMSEKPRGFAIVINNWLFLPQSPGGEPDIRTGHEGDEANLERLFPFLEFDMRYHENLSRQEIIDILFKYNTSEELQNHDALILVVLSHGNENAIKTSDNLFYPIEGLYSWFSNKRCKKLAGKPKIFIVQACRGGEVDTGVTFNYKKHSDGMHIPGVTTDTWEVDIPGVTPAVADGPDDITPSMPSARSADEPSCLPSYADTYLIRPNTDGLVAFRADQGSCLISTITDVFINRAGAKNITDMMTEVTRRLSVREFQYQGKKCKMCPDTKSTLTKSLYFFPEYQRGSQTALSTEALPVYERPK